MAQQQQQQQLLQFQPFSSAIDVTFWNELSKRKLAIYKLDESKVPIFGHYGPAVTEQAPSHLCLSMDSFNSDNYKPQSGNSLSHGSLLNTNTLESFKALDKQKVLDEEGERIAKDIESGAAVANPSLLNRFLILAFSDLKKYRFYYWCAFPAISYENAAPIQTDKSVSIGDYFSEPQLTDFKAKVQALYQATSNPEEQTCFLVKKTGQDSVEVALLSQWSSFYSAEKQEEIIFGFQDPSSLRTHPGWSLRNLLALLSKKFAVTKATVICYRQKKNAITDSIVIGVSLPSIQENAKLKSVGWEKNKDGKNLPRAVNLGSTMDPLRLAANAVDLNLQLMRWRLLPSINLSLVANTKCLLLGSGTLGCNVARTLLAWGVRKITFVDNGVVSFSNPVRQTLFEYEDCLNGGKPKSIAAAQRLKSIFPGVEAEGHQLSIPMPGHAVGENDRGKVKADVEKLSTLISEHDVVFLLMDSRESRWLPTVLGNVLGKTTITTALGFDTFLVMRHGLYSEDPEINNKRLGCYFCNDVVAPQDSMKDRTLDQQCTVTRPGLSSLSSAMAVELLVALLHHPKGAHAPSETDNTLYSQTTSPLGLVPHQLRGFISHFNTLLLNTTSFDKCVACADKVIQEYKQRGFEFLLQAFNDPTYLEDLTGLTQLKTGVDVSIDWDEDDEDNEDNSVGKKADKSAEDDF